MRASFQQPAEYAHQMAYMVQALKLTLNLHTTVLVISKAVYEQGR